eukprot:357329-Chlamydomonas_euryale.AAC.4
MCAGEGEKGGATAACAEACSRCKREGLRENTSGGKRLSGPERDSGWGRETLPHDLSDQREKYICTAAEHPQPPATGDQFELNFFLTEHMEQVRVWVRVTGSGLMKGMPVLSVARLRGSGSG